MGLCWWIPSLIFYFWWRRRYNIGAKYWEYEMPLSKKDIFIKKWNLDNEPARLEPQPPPRKK